MADCRFYEPQYPEPEDVVQVKVKRVMDMGAYVSLLEYDNVEGMIMLSELSKRRIRSIKNLIRAGQVMAVSVMRVDEEKGYIDLSRRRVSPAETASMDVKFAKSKMVHSVMRHTSQQHNIPMEKLCSMVAWKLYGMKRFPHAYDAFKVMVSSDADSVFSELPDITPELRESLIANIRRRLNTQALRLRAKVDVSCFGYGGIDDIKESLLKGLEASTEDIKLSITLIAPPTYAISATVLDKGQGMKTIQNAIDLIEAAIASKGGQFALKCKTEIVGDHGDELVKAEDGEELNEGSDSDSSDEEQDETMGGLDDETMAQLEKMATKDDE